MPQDNNIVLIAPDGTNLGVMSLKDAEVKAKEYNLDLICVRQEAKPPVFRIMNYGKYCYELQKKRKQSRKNSKVITKEFRINPQIEENDLNIKVNKIRRALSDGCRIILSITFKGRQADYKEIGIEKINKILSKLEDISRVDKKLAPGKNDKILSCFIIPITNKKHN